MIESLFIMIRFLKINNEIFSAKIKINYQKFTYKPGGLICPILEVVYLHSIYANVTLGLINLKASITTFPLTL